jgi:ABC-type dipeptide/oligopeptide/nickel transport system permease component
VVLFVLLRLLPGDPANALLGVGATEQQIAALRPVRQLHRQSGTPRSRHLLRQPRLGAG